MKKIVCLIAIAFSFSFSRAQDIKQLSGTYFLSEQYRDSVHTYSRKDTNVLRNLMYKDFSKYSKDTFAFGKVIVLYKMMKDFYMSSQLTLNSDSTFLFKSDKDTVKGKFLMYAELKRIQLLPSHKPGKFFNNNILKLQYKQEGNKIDLFTTNRMKVIYSKE